MDIRTCLDRIVVVESALTATIAPTTKTVVKAYKYFPNQAYKISLSDTPCFFNGFTLQLEKRANSLRSQLYEVHSQMIVDDVDKDVAADWAAAFWAKIVDAFDSELNLKGACTTQVLRGGQPTLADLEWAGEHHIGQIGRAHV